MFASSYASVLRTHLMEKSTTNATTVALYLLMQALWRIIWKKHSGERSNKCNQCNFASSHKSALREHLKTHSGEKVNKRNKCDFSSAHASGLRKHLKAHSGEKINKCNQCNFASSYASILRIHLKTHSGEKPNKCTQCDFASCRADNLNSHLKTHTRPTWRCCMIKVYKAGIAMGFDINIASGTTDLGYGAMESIAMHWCHMYSLNPINTISVTLHLWGFLSKYTVVKSQTNATNVTLPLLIWAIWGDIWKHIVGKSPNKFN